MGVNDMCIKICDEFNTCSDGCPLKLSTGKHACRMDSEEDISLIQQTYYNMFGKPITEEDLLAVFDN